MTNHVLMETQKKVQNDGSAKPRQDINRILGHLGYQPIKIFRLNNRLSQLLEGAYVAKSVLRQLESQDTLVVHYPTYMGVNFDESLLRGAQRKCIKIVAFIHDIDSLRFKMPPKEGLKHEIALLNQYSYLIVPNDIMLKFLRKKGVLTASVSLRLFDYLENAEEKEIKYSHIVTFAGNLNKSRFIFKLKNDEGISYHLYGPLEDQNVIDKKLYFGSLPSDILLRKIDSGFGLVWDGADKTISDSSGASYGNYLRFNNPYKLSFYIAAGVPVIIWEDAAEANFVTKYKVGITVNNLSEISSAINRISEKEFSNLVANVEVVRKRILNGEFTSDAISRLENLNNKFD